MAQHDETTAEARTKAAIYCRISRDKTGESLGVTRQLEDCLELAKSLGWEVAEVYTDNDISATTGKPRPAYRKMLADLDAGRAQAIVAWHPDRLYRRAVDLGDLVDTCKRNNVQVATVNAGAVDLTTPTGRLVAGLLAQVAIYEGEHKAERWSRSWRQQRERGVPARTGSRMFGYTRDGELVEEEAKVARRMAADVISGVPILGVARWLEDEGVLTTRGTVWRPGTVRQYLANPRIAGYSTLGGDIVGEGQWEPVLDRDTWETVRALLSARSRPRAPRASILNGLLFCGQCGHRMITSGTKGQRTYRCPKRPGMPGCGGVSGFAEPIEDIIETMARARAADPRVSARMQELRATAGVGELLSEIAALEGRLAELDAELDVPGVPVARLVRAMDRTRERLAECQERLAVSAAVSATSVYSGGLKWPEGLAERRQAIAVALRGYRICLDRPAVKGNRFNPKRVRLEETPDPVS